MTDAFVGVIEPDDPSKQVDNEDRGLEAGVPVVRQRIVAFGENDGPVKVEATAGMTIRPGDGWNTTFATAGTGAALLFTAPAKCVSVDVSNADDAIKARIGPSVARINAGHYRTLFPGGGSVVLELGPGEEVYGQSESGSIRIEFTDVTDSTV